jgi:hypothetical protein
MSRSGLWQDPRELPTSIKNRDGLPLSRILSEPFSPYLAFFVGYIPFPLF